MLEFIKTFYNTHERYLTPIAFLVGFVIDNITLTRIDLLFDNIVLFSYLVIAALGIFLFHTLHGHVFRFSIINRLISFLPIIVQFAFGGLFSGFLIFYSRSASFTASWLFILILVGIILGNELFKKRYAQLSFQIGILYFALFSFSIFYLPILFGEIGAKIFLVSGALSLSFIALFIAALFQFIPSRITKAKNILLTSIFGVYLVINVFYFLNIIPPIPLSLKESGVYHLIVRDSSGDYSILFEKPKWYVPFSEFNGNVHVVSGNPVYFFSSVFAPTNLETTILHKWQFFDEIKSEWVQTDLLQFSIEGGRDGGFRGYTIKRNIFPGKWRVDVVTKRDQLLGRETFTIIDSIDKPVTQTKIR
ncbi:DUF2914 domain-containing protein [Patescibacteria group bacterium]|nr:DUF2914 domain-containing protein [Patescibacteria group bacterium]